MANVFLNATAAAKMGWFDKGVNEQILALPECERDQAALKMKASAIHGIGAKGEEALGVALHKSSGAPLVRQFLAFMSKPGSLNQLRQAAQCSGIGPQAVSGLEGAYRMYVQGSDPI
ncbi:MAG: hypothetical protein IT384_26995 [Deltaproteobacteria bacterium]|nr:hypothetical protein [Deltaproteobacteria bacterium]